MGSIDNTLVQRQIIGLDIRSYGYHVVLAGVPLWFMTVCGLRHKMFAQVLCPAPTADSYDGVLMHAE